MDIDPDCDDGVMGKARGDILGYINGRLISSFKIEWGVIVEPEEYPGGGGQVLWKAAKDGDGLYFKSARILATYDEVAMS